MTEIEELRAEVAELREKFNRERGTWPGPDWMRSVTEGLAGMSMQIASQQLHTDRQFAAILDQQKETALRLGEVRNSVDLIHPQLRRIEEAVNWLTSIAEQEGDPTS